MSHLFNPDTNPYSPEYKLESLTCALSPVSRIIASPRRQTNDILQYLIILTKDDYKSGTFSKSMHDKLIDKLDLFMGILNIEKLDDFKLNNANNINFKYKIDGNITPRLLYIRLPKEKLYVPADVFQERFLDSKMNELISIFSTLCSKSIKISVTHEHVSKINLNIGAGANIKGIEVKSEAKQESESTNKISTVREITFQEPSKNEKLNIDIFGNYNKFFYLPKDESWIDIIRRRINNKASSDDFKYNYKDYNCVTKELSSYLNFLHISLHYNASKYDNLVIAYDVDYYPFTYNVDKVAEAGEDEDEDEAEKKEDKSGNISFFDIINKLNPFK